MKNISLFLNEALVNESRITLSDIQNGVEDYATLVKDGKRVCTFESKINKRLFDVSFSDRTGEVLNIIFYNATSNANNRNSKYIKINGQSLDDIITEIKTQMGF